MTLDTKSSPMMVQWQHCKNQAGDAILLFRLGDFYEAFEEDAHLCSQVLDLTLTKRQNTPMSGMPAHTVEGYIDKLVAKGYKVAIAEQLEEASVGKGIVKREIVKVITPGTLIHSSLLKDKTNNFFASITKVGHIFGLAFFDLSTSECKVIELEEVKEVVNELYRHQTSEILTSYKLKEKHPEIFIEIKRSLDCLVDTIEDWKFDHQLTYSFLTNLFKVHSLEGFGLKGMIAAINAAGALLSFIQTTLRHPLNALQTINPYNHHHFLQLDKTTLKNLEIFECSNGSNKNTLLNVLDYTYTPMGGRLLRTWLSQPLINVNEIKKRQNIIEDLLKNYSSFESLRKHFIGIRDIERIITKISSGNCTPKDFIGLRNSLVPIKNIKSLLQYFSSLESYEKNFNEFHQVTHLIQTAIKEEPPIRINEGGFIKEGYHSELDQLRSLSQNSKDWMSDYQNKIREQTGIKTLKVGFTQVSGFYIEVSKGQSEKVPLDFKRRQTLTNAERFITPELKTFEEKILSVEDKINEIENALFHQIRLEIIQFSKEILENAKSLAFLDCLLSLAFVSHANRYVRPEVHEGTDLKIFEGRHPVIESALLNEKFISNDTFLNQETERLMLITGPNMAGKSTYIRQVALIAIMAQIGSFVPATQAQIPFFDKIFTRIGASDDLSKGQSTFMVEMTETANILHQATSRSLVILDEIGRGTSTYDGISLAWSIAEYLLLTPGKLAKTLFATHYFELTQLEEKIIGAVNYNVAVHESGDEIIFLRKIQKGGTDKSYGIHVARLAGLPPSVLVRAKEILQHLEENSNQKNIFEITRNKRLSSLSVPNSPEIQLNLFNKN